MAAADKIYAFEDQREEFYKWCQANKPDALAYFYEWLPDWSDDGLTHVITSFPQHVDMWLLEECPIEFVVDRIKEQYDINQW